MGRSQSQGIAFLFHLGFSTAADLARAMAASATSVKSFWPSDVGQIVQAIAGAEINGTMRNVCLSQVHASAKYKAGALGVYPKFPKINQYFQ